MLTDNNRIISGAEPVEKPVWMAYPEWLRMDDPGLSLIYADIGAMQEYYVKFALKANRAAQVAMSTGLFNVLNHLGDCVYNKYDYSLAGLNYAKSQIERANLDWLLKLDGITTHMAFQDFDVRAEVQEGHPIKLTGGCALELMTTGDLLEDFLYKHPATHGVFHRYSTTTVMNLIRERMVRLGKDLGDVQLPNPN